MRIEIGCKKEESTKAKGDLFEELTKELLEALGYNVIKEIRFTGVELDLLCKHNINEKEIYVECKAHSESIGAPILRQLNGTVDAYDYAEGWIISISEFGKEAKGFIEMWKKKPIEKSSKLSFYSPDQIIESLQKASIICQIPADNAENFVGGKEFLGDWIMLITSYGRFWAVYTLQGGTPKGVLIYNAKNGRHIQDIETLNNISQLETSFTEYDLKIGEKKPDETNSRLEIKNDSVVEVQIGDSWNDYRPARPQDFVGREYDQKEILAFLQNVRDRKSDTRIFAVTGNSGLGKSSLIAKIRDRTRNKFYKNKYFTFAVDMRGAKSAAYISASLLKCLKSAQEAKIGKQINFKLTNPNTPLSSPSIVEYFQSVEEKGQIICLVFDQFEELYSKPELFNVFNAAKDLMLDVASNKYNFVLGFAWKTDSTTQQDHPAYHMWHELSDYRRVFKLEIFDSGDISKCITSFEKEIKQKIPNEIRHQIINLCQGFPWLLKKLCINIYDNIKKSFEAETITVELDINRLFSNDLAELSQPELTCLKIISQKAPADWSEMIDTSGIAVINSLVNKRLVVKSGDRLNIYWDIFKDFILTKNVPFVPFNYIPVSDITSMAKIYQRLDNNSFQDSSMIASITSLKEKTVLNIGADLVMFGLAERKSDKFKLAKDIEDTSVKTFFERVRDKIGKHSLKLALYRFASGKYVSQENIKDTLKSCLPKARYGEKTWRTYTNRLSNLLEKTGYLSKAGNEYIVQDTGSTNIDIRKILNKKIRKGDVFSAAASPAKVCAALEYIKNGNDDEFLNKNGYRNSLSVIIRFDLARKENRSIELNFPIKSKDDIAEAIWVKAKNEIAIVNCIDMLITDPNVSGVELGNRINTIFGLNWSDESKLRNGNSLKQWSKWVYEGIKKQSVPKPPGRIAKDKRSLEYKLL